MSINKGVKYVPWRSYNLIMDNIYKSGNKIFHIQKELKLTKKKLEMAKNLIIKYRPDIQGTTINRIGMVSTLWEWDETLKQISD